jgi:hypothetical protein
VDTETAPKLDIDKLRRTPKTQLSWQPIKCHDDVEMLIAKANRTRSVSATAMNDQSSRSHCVFMLNIAGCNRGSNVRTESTLNLCDLAGSERLDKSKAEVRRRRHPLTRRSCSLASACIPLTRILPPTASHCFPPSSLSLSLSPPTLSHALSH